jgi:hypothetical protein
MQNMDYIEEVQTKMNVANTFIVVFKSHTNF